MLLSIILTFSLYITGNGEDKRHVPNSAVPVEQDIPSYDIEAWVNQLYLQHCVFVEIGDAFSAVFVEFQTSPNTAEEYFLGICDNENLLKWKLCSSMLADERPEKCTFSREDVDAARVHRRLCDISMLATFAQRCNCSLSLLGQKLYDVTGFPTCFRWPLLDSLCGSNNVCGLASCSAQTVGYHIVTANCSRKCIGQDWFCQYPIPDTTRAATISSFWSDWSDPMCVDVPCINVISEARCINRDSGCGAIDCLGPGTSCCQDEKDCKCHLYVEEGTMKVVRTYTTSESYWQRKETPEEVDNFDFLDSLGSGIVFKQMRKHKKNVKRNINLSVNPYFMKTYNNLHSDFKNYMADMAARDKNIFEDTVDSRNTVNRDARQYEEDFEDDDDEGDDEDIVIEEDDELVATTPMAFEREEAAQIQADNLKNDTLEAALKNEFGEMRTKESSASPIDVSFILLSIVCFIRYTYLVQIYELL